MSRQSIFIRIFTIMVLFFLHSLAYGQENESKLEKIDNKNRLNLYVRDGILVNFKHKDLIPALRASAALLLPKDDGTKISFCSGTLIGPIDVITAAHCVVDETMQIDPPSRVEVFFPLSGIYSVVEILVNPAYRPGTKGEDVAILRLERVVDGIKPVEMSPRIASPGADALVAGYGGTRGLLNKERRIEMLHSGIFRYGKVRLAYCPLSPADPIGPQSDLTICLGDLTVPIESPITCKGDSGGGLFFPDNDGELIGVTSFLRSEKGLEYTGRCLGPLSTGHTNLRRHEDWIRGSVRGSRAVPGETASVCGGFECLSEADILMTGTEYLLPGANSERTFEITVERDYDKILVSVNGQQEDDATLSGDRRLKLSVPGCPQAQGCAGALAPTAPDGPFATCTIEKPNRGNLSIKVQSCSGSGLFQINVAGFSKKPKVNPGPGQALQRQ
jgi:hypothetical protein